MSPCVTALLRTHFLTPVSFAQEAYFPYFPFQEQLETSRREMIGLQERDRQLQCKNRSLHQLLKNEKDEVSVCSVSELSCWLLKFDVGHNGQFTFKQNCQYILCDTGMVDGQSCVCPLPLPQDRSFLSNTWQQVVSPVLSDFPVLSGILLCLCCCCRCRPPCLTLLPLPPHFSKGSLSSGLLLLSLWLLPA